MLEGLMSQEFLPILSGADFPSTEQPMAEFVPSLDSSWRLVIVNHKVHCDVANCKGPRQRPPKSICQCLTISNLRAFSVAVELQVLPPHLPLVRAPQPGSNEEALSQEKRDQCASR